MLPTIAALLFVFIGSLQIFIHLRGWKTSPPPSKKEKNANTRPPGPYPLPIIGSLHMLGNLPHRSFKNLAQNYGPIMSISLGNVPTIVVSSPHYAEQFLKTHDAIFASRPKLLAAEYMFYGNKGISFTEYGPYWGNMRKLCTLELLTSSKIESFRRMRRDEIMAKVESIKRYAKVGEVMDVSTMLTELVEDIACKMVLGRSKDDRFDMKGVIHEFMILSGSFNISDYVSWLGPFDLQGLNRRMMAVSKSIDEITEAIINDHELAKGEEQSHHKNFTGMLLSLMNDQKNSTGEGSYHIDRTNVKAIMMEILIASMDSTATISQWIFLNLMKHPRVMKKLQEELQTVVGLSKIVHENDLANLIYLDMVIKESFRLHSVGALLIPHQCMQETTIDGYLIPKASRVIVNIWAIGRNQEVWSENAEDFYPERFEGSNVDFRSRHFQLLPFSHGRRGCPGMKLGLTMTRIVVAQLVHCFEWELPKGMLPQDVDMTENFGLAIFPAKSLFAIPKYRLHV